VFVFSGQGSQYAGMGSALSRAWPAYRAAMEECAAAMAPHLDRPLFDVLRAPDEELARTEHTQPAVFALSYALARLWESFGVRPAAAIGHSVGEYAALCVTGAVSLQDAAALVAARG